MTEDRFKYPRGIHPGKTIRAVFKEMCLPDTEAARLLGVSVEVVRNLLYRYADLTKDMAQRLEKLGNLDADRLIRMQFHWKKEVEAARAARYLNATCKNTMVYIDSYIMKWLRAQYRHNQIVRNVLRQYMDDGHVPVFEVAEITEFNSIGEPNRIPLQLSLGFDIIEYYKSFNKPMSVAVAATLRSYMISLGVVVPPAIQPIADEAPTSEQLQVIGQVLEPDVRAWLATLGGRDDRVNATLRRCMNRGPKGRQDHGTTR